MLTGAPALGRSRRTRRAAAPAPAAHQNPARAQKVNEKNSWSLNLIDHMGDVLSKPPAPGSAAAAHADDADGGVTNFQVASCTLDAGVKIYSYRVDSVYSTAFRVLGGLNRTGAAPGEGARSRYSASTASRPRG